VQPRVSQLAEGLFPSCPGDPGLTEGVVIVEPPSNYDNANIMIRVDPNTLYACAAVDMTQESQVIVDAINSIVGIWNNLRLGWAGATADQAQDFSNRWLSAVNAFFGTKDNPEDGAFPRIIDAVLTAADNYGQAEDTNVQMFRALADELNSPPSTPPPPTRDQNQGPITENAPAPP
jgi:hypothetical protein